MDAKDAEASVAAGSAAIGRERRTFWALLLIHTLLTGACFATSLYTLQRSPVKTSPPLSNDTGILLNMNLMASHNSPKLLFSVTWNQGVELNHGSEVKVHYPGPYIFYICATMRGTDGDKGILTLEQGKLQTSIELQVKENSGRCARHERLVSLYENDVITFKFENRTNPKLKVLRVGLHYMLGAQHFKTPNE